MIDRISAFVHCFGGGVKGGGPSGSGELRLAVAALLVEAACMDRHFDAAERRTIARLLSERFDLADDEVAELIAQAEQTVADSTQLFPFTRTVARHFSERERIELIEMLWEVAYADGELDEYEASLLRRVGGLIYVADKDSGAARQRVLARRRKGGARGP
ncbi:MAG: TerB family tellurite resistance protein [Alphaproteobacteria bacterium]